MDSKTANELLAHLAPIAQGNAQLIQAATSILSQVTDQAAEKPKPASDSGIVVRELAPRTETPPVAVQALPTPAQSPMQATAKAAHQPSPSPKADQTDELAEQIMDLLETKPDGMTPRDIGKSVKVPHQSYRFRKAMLGLKKEGRLELLDSDNPKKLRYRIAGFAPDNG